jgi:hypothetical protein
VRKRRAARAASPLFRTATLITWTPRRKKTTGEVNPTKAWPKEGRPAAEPSRMRSRSELWATGSASVAHRTRAAATMASTCCPEALSPGGAGAKRTAE